jgi:hypothetical protein
MHFDKDISELTPEEQELIFPTKWKTTQPDPKANGYMISVTDDNKAQIPESDESGQRLTGTVTDGDEVNEVSITHLPYEKWIKACGTVANMAIQTSRALEKGKFADGDWLYRHRITQDFIAADHVRYLDGLGHKNYRDTDEWRAEWKGMREAFIKDRQAKQSARMSKADRKHEAAVAADKMKVQKMIMEGFKSMVESARDKAERHGLEFAEPVPVKTRKPRKPKDETPSE